MQDKDLNNLLSLAVSTAKEATQIIAKELEKIKKIRVDLHRDVKIEADHKLEETIVKNLLSRSGYPILSEEIGLVQAKEVDNGYRWIVDPLDGSINFSRGIPMCCVSIALWKGMDPIIGVVYDFNRDETFTGIVGLGAWLNGVSVRVSKIAEASKAILCTGFPVSTDFSKKTIGKFVKDIQDYKKVRLFGSAALSLAYVSCGRVDSYREDNIKIWDVAAGLSLVLAAGGAVEVKSTESNVILIVRASNEHLIKI